MRPKKLTMKAFGSFAQETVVDFDQLSGGLYLIVGKTGAGKTTIFDAISFALFGVPSGTERKPEMVHSDFVPLSEDTEVSLDFVHQGRAYTVSRRVHFRKKRGGQGYGEPEFTAAMSGEGMAPLEKRVTAQVEALLGLNAEQFRRIVMLAQGEFRAFLRAGSDEKNKILGKLFDNTAYVRYQNLLSAAAKTLAERQKRYRDEIDTAMGTLFTLPAQGAAEDYLPGHPRLAENLLALIAREEETLTAYQGERARLEAAVQELTRKEGAAEADNRLLDDLAANRAALTELEAQEGDFAARRETYELAEKALHRVRPQEEEAARQAEALAQTRAELHRVEARLAGLDADLQAAQATVEADAPQRAQAEALAGEAATLKEALPRYGQLAQREAERAQGQRALEQAQAEAGALVQEKAAVGEALTATRQALAALTGCGAQAVRLEAEREAAQARWEAVSAPQDGLAQAVQAIQEEERALAAEGETLRALTLAAAEAENRHHALYQAFLAGQAGLIAARMEDELAEKGATVCPVCNTPFCREDGHRFALPAEKVPEKSAVDRAEKAAKAAEGQRQHKQAELERRASLVEQRKETVTGRAQKLDATCLDWATLAAPGWLSALEAQLDATRSEAEAAYAAAQAQCREQERLAAQEQEQGAAQEALETRLQAEKARCDALERELTGLSSAVAELRRQLPYPTVAEAQARLDALKDQRAAVQATLEAHETALREAKAALDRAVGGLNTLKAALPEREKAATEAAERLQQALRENDFADTAALHAALAVLGDVEGETWLLREKEAQDDYRHSLTTTRQRVAALAAQTTGLERQDVEALQRACQEAQAARAEAAARLTAQMTLLENHRAVSAKVSAAQAALVGLERAYRRLGPLAELAVGANSEGGKLSFDRYVTGAHFREVLEMANRRLDTMTGGRFALLHTVEAGRKNAVAGFEIEVLDVALGKRRPSGSISGGEGFMVSLALALGLSDVVQSHAGGQKLDTLFIDEGFGTLDDGKLDKVIEVLNQLTEGNRLVGIISHVDKLEESITQKLRVTSSSRGSSLAIEIR